MSLRDIRSECSDVAGLLQPYVDAELSEEEQERVALHLSACRGCRAAVSEQSWVRATLRALPREPAPQAMRAKVLLALDTVDREDQARVAAATPVPSRPGLAARIWSRLADLGRGGLIMVPAGAAAIGLFFVVRDATLPTEGSTAGPAMGIGGAVDLVAGQRPPSAPADDALGDLAKLPPQVGFEPQVPTSRAEDGVQLVGANLDRTAGSAAARLRFRLLQHGRPTGHHVIDHQLPATEADVRGRPVSVGGRRYHLERDDTGAAVLHFIVGGVAHALRLEGPSTRFQTGEVVDDSGEIVPADFAPLLPVADHFAPTAGRRD